MARIILIIICVNFTVYNNVFSQLNSFENLEQFEKKGSFKNNLKGFFKDFTDFGEPFQFGGAIGLNMRSYNAEGGPLRQDPFFYAVNANINFRIYQIDIPFSMILTAKNSTHSYPSISDLKQSLKDKLQDRKNGFARIGISPYYKWAKIHLGHRAMNFSKFTMSNLNFFGAGMELTPGKVRVSGMYGRLAKAEPIDLSLATPNLPVYRRIGWATKLGYGDDKASADLVIFGAKDDQNSLSLPAEYPKQVTPEANLAIGIQLQKLFFDIVRIKVDYTNSAVSPNALDADSEKKSITNFLMSRKNTTYFSNAFESSVAYEGKLLNAGVLFTRIDADYKTLGTYFFNRDIMDVQGFVNFGLLDGKVNTALKAGIQSNNLDNSKPTTTRRFIYDAQLGYAANDLSANFNYSNNTSRIGYVLNQQLDSLNAVIITQDIGLNVNYALPSGDLFKHAVSLTGNIQDVSDDIEKPEKISTSKIMMANLGYFVSLPADWAISLRANYSRNIVQSIELNRIGYGLGVRKSLFEKKLSLGLDGNIYHNKNQFDQKSRNIIGQFSLGYQLFKGMGLQIQWGLLNTTSDTGTAFTESIGNLGLQYQFNYSPKKKTTESAK